MTMVSATPIQACAGTHPEEGRSALVSEAEATLRFEEFYADTAARLMRQLLALTRDTAEAQDCLQEAYARAWQRWSSVSVHPDPEAWVRQVAHRCAISRFRKARNNLVATFRHGPPPAVPGMRPDHLALMEALQHLPAAQREVIVLHHLADLPVEEVASVVGAPVGTVKARLSRGRAALSEVLSRTEYFTGPLPRLGADGHPVASAPQSAPAGHTMKEMWR